MKILRGVLLTLALGGTGFTLGMAYDLYTRPTIIMTLEDPCGADRGPEVRKL